MSNHYEGVIVHQEAIDWWPYIGVIVNRINEACEKRDSVLLTDIFLDAGALLRKTRRDRTVNGMKSCLQHTLRFYKSETKNIVRKKKRLQNKYPVGVSGKPLAASTLKRYRYDVKNWPKDRERMKKSIRDEIQEIKPFSPKNGKVITRGNASMQLIYGGRHPVSIKQHYEGSGWQRVR